MTPHVLLASDDDGHFGLSALSISSVNARERERGRLTDEDLIAAFSRQRDLVSALHSPLERRRFELRTLVNPSPGTPARGTISLYVVARVGGSTAREAHADTVGAIRDVQSLLHGLNEEYDTDVLVSAEELAYALRPFQFRHMAEIRKREAVLRAGSLSWNAPRRLGFAAPLHETAQSDEPGHEVVYHAYPLAPRPLNLLGLYRILLSQPDPLLISALVEPTFLTENERRATHESVSRIERWLATPGAGTTEPGPPREILRSLARTKLAKLGSLEDGAFAVRVRVASPLELRSAILESIAQNLSAPAGDARPEEGLLGGADWQMVSPGDLERAADELACLGAGPLHSSMAPADERRLVCL